MFNSIKGLVTGKSENRLYLENQGIEWSLEISLVSLSKLPSLGQEARVYTYLHHKEDIMTLYGFESEIERTLFLNLISVSGVGPKGAIRILSGISVKDFMLHLEQEDVKNLSKLPGLGTKTAQKIILQLKGKLITSEESTGPVSDLVEALSSMGFDKKKAQLIVKNLEREDDIRMLPKEVQEQEIMRRAIMELSQ